MTYIKKYSHLLSTIFSVICEGNVLYYEVARREPQLVYNLLLPSFDSVLLLLLICAETAVVGEEVIF